MAQDSELNDTQVDALAAVRRHLVRQHEVVRARVAELLTELEQVRDERKRLFERIEVLGDLLDEAGVEVEPVETSIGEDVLGRPQRARRFDFVLDDAGGQFPAQRVFDVKWSTPFTGHPTAQQMPLAEPDEGSDWSQKPRSEAVDEVLFGLGGHPVSPADIASRLGGAGRDDSPRDVSGALAYLSRQNRAVRVGHGEWVHAAFIEGDDGDEQGDDR